MVLKRGSKSRMRMTAVLAVVFALSVAGAPVLVASSATASTAEDVLTVIPPEWSTYDEAPVEREELTDVATGAPVRMYKGVAIFHGGETVEYRVKLSAPDVPSVFARYHATVIRVTNEQGTVVHEAPIDIGAPAMDDRESWVRYVVPSRPGVYFLALTAEPADREPGYMVGFRSFAVLPTPQSDPGNVVGGAGAGVGSIVPPPAPPRPAPPIPAPAAPAAPVAPAPAPAAPVPEKPAVPDGAVEAGYEGDPGAAESVPMDIRSEPVGYPGWALPTLLGAGGVVIAGLVVWRATIAAQRRASIRRLSGRP